jgi:hypothetical protein
VLALLEAEHQIRAVAQRLSHINLGHHALGVLQTAAQRQRRQQQQSSSASQIAAPAQGCCVTLTVNLQHQGVRLCIRVHIHKVSTRMPGSQHQQQLQR